MEAWIGILATGWALTLIMLVWVNKYSHRLENEKKVLLHQQAKLVEQLHTAQTRLRTRRRADEIMPQHAKPKVDQRYVGDGVPREREAPTAGASPTPRRWAGGKSGDPSGGTYGQDRRRATAPRYGDAPRPRNHDLQSGRVRPGQAAELPSTQAGSGSHEESDPGQQQS